MIKVNKRTKGFLDALSNNNNVLRLKFKVIEPLHISSGNLKVINGKLVHEMQRYGKDVLIPGSSIKGAFRTYFEYFFSDDYANEIFGRGGAMSKVFFNDVLIPSKYLGFERIFKQYNKKSCESRSKNNKDKTIKNYKMYHCKHDHNVFRGRYLTAEVIRKETIFETEIITVGLDGSDITNLLTTVGANPNVPFYINIGRGKEQGLGRVKIDPIGNIDWNKANSELLREAKKFASETGCGVRL